MYDHPLDLSDARILLSNDDGIAATGLKVLERVARKLSRDVWVVAPETEQSAASHSLTLRRPLRIRKLSARKFAVDGTPTDSVLLAIKKILRDHPPDIVLSGVNRGANMGEDVTYSGTIAAAMEGTLLGIRSVALSQLYSDGERTKWAAAEEHAPDLLRRLAAAPWQRNVMINVNFPDVAAEKVAGVDIVALGRRKIGGELSEGFDPRGRPYYWVGGLRDEEPKRRQTDLATVYGGAISVTPLYLDMTHRPSIRALRKVLD